MKTRKEIKNKFLRLAAAITPVFLPYELPPSNPNSRHMFIVRRKVASKWQFMALSFAQEPRRLFLELACSDNEDYPIDRFSAGPNLSDRGIQRFRAADLWGNTQSGGWIIQIPGRGPLNDSMIRAEGIFNTVDELMGNIDCRVKNWVLPYFEIHPSLKMIEVE
jgi:hypothetical protein